MEYVKEIAGSVLGSREAVYPINLITIEIRKSTKGKLDLSALSRIVADLTAHQELEAISSTIHYEENRIDSILVDSWIPMYISKTIDELSDVLTDEGINYFVVMKYKNFDFLKAIYFQKIRREFRYYIFFESAKYDSEKMEKLVSSELEIMDIYPDLYMNFIYLPFGPDSSAFLSGKSAKKIF